MQHFHARLASGWFPSGTIHRIYITDTDFLFIHLDIGTLHPEQYAERAPVATGGGAIPALIGAAIGYCAAKVARERLDRLTRSLEAADEDVLRQFAAEDENSFVLSFHEIQRVSLTPRTFWSSLFRGDVLAFLNLDRIGDSLLTLGLIAPNEMVTVAEEMRKRFEDVTCELSWRAF